MLNWLAVRWRSIIRSAKVNRRRERRVPLKIPIEVRIVTGATYAGVSRDLSPLGMGAIVSAPLNVGDQVWVKYEHPISAGKPQRTVVRPALTRQRFGYRYGFEFQLPLDF